MAYCSCRLSNQILVWQSLVNPAITLGKPAVGSGARTGAGAEAGAK